MILFVAAVPRSRPPLPPSLRCRAPVTTRGPHSRHRNCVSQCYERVKSADTQTLKEKYEEELKREIKKLQRLRDQIKVSSAPLCNRWI